MTYNYRQPVCDNCKNPVPGLDILRSAEDRVNRAINYIKTEKSTICPTCVNEFLQMQRINQQEYHLYTTYIRNAKTNLYEWENAKGQRIDIFPRYSKYLNLDKFRHDPVYKDIFKPLYITSIVASPITDNYKEMSNNIMGVSLPDNVSMEQINPNCMSCPSFGFGYIKLPRGDDFVLIEASNFTDTSILSTSLEEMTYISKGVLSPRAGAAGGFMLPGAISRSLSPVTNNHRCLTTRKNSVAMSLTYKNHNNETKGRNAVYKDLHMRRLSSHQKYKMVLKNVQYQNILLNEMISRLRCFVILHEKGIMSFMKIAETFLDENERRSSMHAGFVSTGRSELEAKLLSWACSSGEMRNHMAVKAHVDGNTSHPVETMTLFGRLPTNKDTYHFTSLRKQKDGYLILPLEGITFKIRCGYDIIHCSLKNTIHVADNSRNTCCWSKVHGP